MSAKHADVSVIMPAFNAAPTIARSMASALAQEGASVELVVVDDCSRDGTWEVVQDLAARDRRIVPIRHLLNRGVAAARNTGLDAASGKRIAFLDSDDRWLPGKLAAQLDFMRQHDGLVCYAGYRRVDATGALLSTVVPPARVDYAAMLRSNHIGNLTGIFDRRIGAARFRKIGHEDYVFWLELVRRAGVAWRVPAAAPLAEYLVRSDSLSSDKWRAAHWQWDIYRNVAGLDPLRSGWYFLHYAALALGKRR